MEETMNIFQIWDSKGRKIPFKVRREHWNQRYCVVVERIECDNMPFGKAFGYSTDNGIRTDHFSHDKKWRITGEIPCAGCYQWYFVEE